MKVFVLLYMYDIDLRYFDFTRVVFIRQEVEVEAYFVQPRSHLLPTGRSK